MDSFREADVFMILATQEDHKPTGSHQDGSSQYRPSRWKGGSRHNAMTSSQRMDELGFVLVGRAGADAHLPPMHNLLTIQLRRPK